MAARGNTTRWLASSCCTRRILNVIYDFLPWRSKQRFLNRAKIFRGQDFRNVQNGCWKVTSAEKTYLFPLEACSMWLDWDLAVSFLGHDAEIKYTYAKLVKSPLRPKLFFDIGANYGLDSLFFIVQGIRTISFEPNVYCHDYIRRTIELNGCRCEIQALALADCDGMVDLWFPKNETWLGSIDQSVLKDWGNQEIERILVKQTTLDHFASSHCLQPQLIKIDTEGTELQILQGGLETLRSFKPIVVFESWIGGERAALMNLFKSLEYTICSLPFPPNNRCKILDEHAFLDSNYSNYIACSIESVALLQAVLNSS